MAGIPRIPREIHRQIDVAGIPRGWKRELHAGIPQGRNLFFRWDAREILRTMKIDGDASVRIPGIDCHAKCPVWLLNT